MSRAGVTYNGPAVLGALRAGAQRGVRFGAEHLLQVSRARVPIEEGTLERSGVVSVDEDNLTSAVSYDTKYAVRQHEELDYRHDAGREAKYLEKPLREEADTIQNIIAAEVRRAIR
ncbi:hypothetical protein ACIBAC_15180 [Streptomyces sp. NPDC051362]|uniref:hypothetical protein n=1 Tax=Streptomyces sp. NPDC051362 TaxID=3365651 RepID=UPI0037B25CB6